MLKKKIPPQFYESKKFTDYENEIRHRLGELNRYAHRKLEHKHRPAVKHLAAKKKKG